MFFVGTCIPSRYFQGGPIYFNSLQFRHTLHHTCATCRTLHIYTRAPSGLLVCVNEIFQSRSSSVVVDIRHTVKMLRILSGIVLYVETALSAISGGPEKNALRELQFNNLKQHLTQITPDIADATETMQELQKESFLTPEQKTEIATIINSRLQGGANPAEYKSTVSKNATQHFLHIYEYFTEEAWSRLMSTTIDNTQKFEMISDLMLTLNCFNPCEVTKATVVATITKASGQHVNPHQFYDLLTEFKATFVSKKEVAAKSKVPMMINYPSTGAEFCRLHPDVYEAGHPPVSARVSPKDIIAWRNRNPMRASSKLLRDATSKPAPAVQNAGDLTQQCLGLLLTALQGRGGGSSSSSDGALPAGFTLTNRATYALGGQAVAAGFAAPPTPGALPALMNGALTGAPPSPAQSAPSPPAVMVPRTPAAEPALAHKRSLDDMLRP